MLLFWALSINSVISHRPTILDKTVEKIVYLDSIFLPSLPSPESNVVVFSKESLIPGRLWEATLNWGKGFSFRKGVVLEIVLLRRKVDMMGKTFSSSFVRDCRLATTLFQYVQSWTKRLGQLHMICAFSKHPPSPLDSVGCYWPKTFDC